ncbi:MMPL family transporter [Nocardia sp. NPDC059177]|uniref:MMPL family transporter n=1 Tax=Nocardia sp. NPDC059177 TaxID=3346759 RepID=UPI0036BCE139
MFTRWGDLVYRFRFVVIGVVGAALLALGAYGTGLGDRLTQSGWFDPGSESVRGAEIADAAFGRDHMADVIVMYNAPEGTTIDDPAFSQPIIDNLNAAVTEHPDQISKINGTYWKVGNAPSAPSAFGSKDKKHAFASIAIVGNDDTTIMANYRVVADAFYIPGIDVEVSGLQPLGVTLNDTITHDSKRMEVLAIPAVAILLFFIFGGIVAAALPLIIGGLTIIGATGIVMVLTNFTDVNSFVTGVVSMIGLGLAIDYGLFIVSRFREELAEGYDTRAAVRRSVVTAGRTVVFSATMIIASLGGVLLFPQGFLRSVAYGTIATVSLAALTAVTILPAMLAVLGPRVDMLGLKRFRKTKTADQIENGFWGKLTRWVMRHPLKIAIPVTVGLLLLIIPVKNLAFGGINEKYLPPDNSTRLALEHFYEVFPQKKTDPIQLVFVVGTGDKADTDAIGQVWKQANQAPGLVEPFAVPSNPPDDRTVYRTSATLVDPTGNAEPTIDYLRSIEVPDNVTLYVTGQPTLMADSIDTLLELMPWMILIVLLSTFILMFLTFGSLVLPIKAALMSALGLGSTLGILTWIFIDGNGAGLLNFTPQPISAPVLMLIIAIIYGLSTDYEVFLLSRMVEARAQGASTTEAVRIGTAQTGRIITAAALILLVVTGAFAFSDMVMMQYIAYGMIAALFIDATVLRMLLVPAIMKLLGDDCWWAPKWMKRIQEKIGLGEPILDDERPQKGAVVDLVKTTPITDPPTMQMTAVPDSKLAKTPRRPRTVAEIEAEAPTAHLDKITEHTDSTESPRPRMAQSPDPTRPRASMLSEGEPTRVLPVVKPGAEPPAPDAGEPTQILPIVKPDTPKDSSGHADSIAGSPDTGLDLPGEPGHSDPNPSGDSAPGAPGATGSGAPSDVTGDQPFGMSGGGLDLPGVAMPGQPRTGEGQGGDGVPGVIGSNHGSGPGSTSPTNHPGANSILDAPRRPLNPDTAPTDRGLNLPGGADSALPTRGTEASGIPPRGAAESGFPTSGSEANGLPTRAPGGSSIPPRGSERVRPPAGYTPPSDGPSIPQVSTPDTTGFAEDPAPRPSIVTPTRPNTVSPPSAGIATPPAPSIVNPPPRPNIVNPQARPTEPPAGGTFSGFTPLPTPDFGSRPAEQDQDPEPGILPPSTDLSANPGAHRAETTEPPRPLVGQETPPTRGIFGTPVPVEPQEHTAPWTDDSPGPTFTPVTPAENASPTPRGLSPDPMFTPVNLDEDATEGSAPQASGPSGWALPADTTAASGFGADQAVDPGEMSAPSVVGPTFSPVTPDPATAAPRGVDPVTADAPSAPWSSDAEANGRADTPTPPSGPVGWAPPREQPAAARDGADRWQAPDGFTAVPHPAGDTSSTTPESEDEPRAENRDEIENWMAQLRSSRRGTAADDSRHTGNEGRTVSVNELLRRREDDTD